MEELFDSLLQKYKKELEKSVRECNFVFDSVDLLHYKLHKINLVRGGTYINSPEWLKKKKATINPINNDDECFQYVVTAILHHQDIK